ISTTQHVFKRQAFVYDPELNKYAQINAKTVYSHGTAAIYDPEDYPKWYSRQMFKWNTNQVHSPYHLQDSRYETYQQAKYAGSK
uniref:DUF3068 domain-containing protein n=1 Tax=Rhabditophanes sp. KR3021 TaxID=114890 RepID=A0AC35TJC2_9BILA